MDLPKLQSKEVTTDGRPVNQPGIYKHKDTGATFITSDGDAGIVQADALMIDRWKDAWERVGDVPDRLEILKMRKVQAMKDAKTEAQQKKADEAEIKSAVEGKLPEGGETYDPKK